MKMGKNSKNKIEKIKSLMGLSKNNTIVRNTFESLLINIAMELDDDNHSFNITFVGVFTIQIVDDKINLLGFEPDEILTENFGQMTSDGNTDLLRMMGNRVSLAFEDILIDDKYVDKKSLEKKLSQ